MLAELSYFYRQICAKEVSKKMMRQWEKEIVCAELLSLGGWRE
jgi:hypothetical protein